MTSLVVVYEREYRSQINGNTPIDQFDFPGDGSRIGSYAKNVMLRLPIDKSLVCLKFQLLIDLQTPKLFTELQARFPCFTALEIVNANRWDLEYQYRPEEISSVGYPLESCDNEFFSRAIVSFRGYDYVAIHGLEAVVRMRPHPVKPQILSVDCTIKKSDDLPGFLTGLYKYLAGPTRNAALIEKLIAVIDEDTQALNDCYPPQSYSGDSV